MPINILCATCKQPFIADRRSAKFCGATCRKRHNRNPTAYRRKVTPSDHSVTGLRVVPLTLGEANAAVALWHRHHRPVRWHTFSLGVMHGDDLVGAAIIFRPAARHYDSKEVAEVARLATDGTPNVCSMLYAAAARTCQAMGYRSIQTYILDHEPGTSLRGAGWTLADRVTDTNWGTRSERGAGQVITSPKKRWTKQLTAATRRQNACQRIAA